MVGLHFFAFGSFIARVYYLLCTVVTAGALAGAMIGLAGATTAAVDATSGLTAAAALLATAGYRTFHPAAAGPKVPAGRGAGGRRS